MHVIRKGQIRWLAKGDVVGLCNTSTEGNGRLVFKSDLEFAMDTCV
jgi:hypothetical protein